MQPHQMNGPLLVLSQIMRNVMASAAEAELNALFENAKEAVVLRTTLQELDINNRQPQYKWIIL
eukprot:1368175-Ditylum_brightwellii.AAC.1